MKEFIVEYDTEQLENSTMFYGGKIKHKLIRCKDCAFWDSEDGKKGYCNGFNLVYRQFESDYYCATAERKQE